MMQNLAKLCGGVIFGIVGSVFVVAGVFTLFLGLYNTHVLDWALATYDRVVITIIGGVALIWIGKHFVNEIK